MVFTVGDDPVALGLVSSLNRPVGNVTGIRCSPTAYCSTKRLELLRELMPATSIIGVLMNPDYLRSTPERSSP